jgi:hypothetical protein
MDRITRMKMEKYFIDTESSSIATDMQKEFREAVMKRYNHIVTDNIDAVWDGVKKISRELKEKYNTLSVIQTDDHIFWMNCHMDSFSMRLIAKQIKRAENEEI